MNVFCENCGFECDSKTLKCPSCSNYLGDTNTIINKLYQRLNEIDAKYQYDIKSIRASITDLKATLKVGVKTVKEDVITEKSVIIKPIEEQSNRVNVKVDKKDTGIKPIQLERKESPVSKPVVKVPAEPSMVELKLKELLSPINAGLELLISVYTKYKTEKKLPIFFMTIAGIIAILFGAGFLMQLSFGKLGAYQGVVKIGAGFAFSIGAILVGSRLSKKDGIYKEYAASLISLGIILNYLLVYFLTDLGDFPILSNAIFGFILISLNTLVSIYFSLKYEAKIISIIALIGGAFTPFYLNEFSDGNLYFLYLWFLCVGTSYVAKKIKWKSLNYIVFVVALATIEYMVFNHNPSLTTYAIYFHLLAYTFFFLSMFDGLKLKENLEKVDVIILSGNLSFFLYNLYTLYDDNLTLLGVVYGVNALVFLIVLVLDWKLLNKSIKLVLFSIVGMLIAFAIPSIFDQDLMGLFWAIEAVLLIGLGFLYAFPLVRKEGYLLLLISCGKLVLSSVMILNHWGGNLWHIGLVNYFALGIIFIAIWFVGRKYKAEFVGLEKTLHLVIQEIVPVWLATVYFMVGYHLVGNWIFNLSIIPLFGFIYWKKRFNTRLTDILGFLHLFLLTLGFLISIKTTNSIHFSDQKMYAQLILIEVMAAFWLIKLFYQKIKLEEEDSFILAKSLRVLFFTILPILLINVVRKHFFEFIELGFWVGALMTYFLFKKLDYITLKLEFYILSLIGFLICFTELDVIGILSGLLVMLVMMFLEKGIKYSELKLSPFKSYIQLFPYAITALICGLIFSFGEGNTSIGLSIGGLLLFVMVYFYDKIGPILESKTLAFTLAGIINLISMMSLVFDESPVALLIVITNNILFSVILSNENKWFIKHQSSHWKVSIVFNQIQYVIIYMFILFKAGIDLEGPITSILLTLHAIVLLFVAMKNQIKILNKLSIVLFVLALIKVIFHDISDFSLIQKIIVLIFLGLLLLAASYGYVRLSKVFGKEIKSGNEMDNGAELE